MEYYSAIKRNDRLIHTTIYMGLEEFMLNEESQTLKVTACMYVFLYFNDLLEKTKLKP